MKIAIIDADLIGRSGHRFPNLACMKISSYWKSKGDDVELKLDYKDLDQFDQVFISKVFSDTPIPEEIKETETIHLGGTGFYFDKAPNLPDEIDIYMMIELKPRNKRKESLPSRKVRNLMRKI